MIKVMAENKKEFNEFKDSCFNLRAKILKELEGADSKEAIFALHEAIIKVINMTTEATKEQKYSMYSLLIGFFETERNRFT